MSKSKWHFDASPLVGSGYVMPALGIRFTFAEHAVAGFLSLIFFELMVQYDLGPDPLAGAGPSRQG